MTPQDAAASPDVVTGILSIDGQDVTVLIDPGSTHSFISRACSLHLERDPDPMSDRLVVATPSGNSMIASTVFRDCKIMLAEKEFVADLVPLDMHGFDIILGMDWLDRKSVV